MNVFESLTDDDEYGNKFILDKETNSNIEKNPLPKGDKLLSKYMENNWMMKENKDNRY